MNCPQVSVWASLRERSVALATHAHNDLFTWKQRKRRWLRAGMEGIGQLTSNQGSSGNSGCLRPYNLTGSGDSSGSCLEMSSGCQHVCSAQEFDPVPHVKVCLCITCTDALNAAGCLDFHMEYGQPERCSVTSWFWLSQITIAVCCLCRGGHVWTRSFEQKWMHIFFQPPSTLSVPADSWKRFTWAATTHWQATNCCWVDFDFEAKYSTPLPCYPANTSNKHRVAPVRTQKQPWHRIIRGNILFHKEEG